jgi:hypothetical protein
VTSRFQRFVLDELTGHVLLSGDKARQQMGIIMIHYFFSGKEYIRVKGGEIGPGTMDPGYLPPISKWNWGAFGANGVDAALCSDGGLPTVPDPALAPPLAKGSGE